MRRVFVVLVAVVVSSLGATRTAQAQRLTLFGGTTAYRFVDREPFGFHAAPVGGIAFDVSYRVLRIDLTVSAFTYMSAPEGGLFGPERRRIHVLPELGLYVQRPSGRLRPYVGAGAGATLQLQSDRWYRLAELSLHAAFGVDATLNDAWDVRCDFRGRGVNGFGETLGLTLGLTRRF